VKKRTKIFLCILGVFAAGIVAVFLWQRNNLAALYMGLRYSTEELESRLAAQESAIEQAVGKLPGSRFQPLTKEQEEQLRRGEMSQEEAVMIMTGKTGTAGAPEPAGNADAEKQDRHVKAGEQGDGEADDKAAQIDALVAQIFLLRSTMLSKLEALMNAATEEYKNTPAEEREKQKKQIYLKYYGQASALESECDTAIDNILKQLQPLLKETGSDLTLINDIKNAYLSEKSVKKAYYMSLYT
jgi:hypothetical protein